MTSKRINKPGNTCKRQRVTRSLFAGLNLQFDVQQKHIDSRRQKHLQAPIATMTVDAASPTTKVAASRRGHPCFLAPDVEEDDQSS